MRKEKSLYTCSRIHYLPHHHVLPKIYSTINYCQPYAAYRLISKYRRVCVRFFEVCLMKGKRLHAIECQLAVKRRRICEVRCILKFLHIFETFT